ncbi:PAS-domain containing protein [Acidimangrovimonas pyrenivorans]|uniref:PAS-domain containing protein n=1 Tax=Acidimangrovimonas pyrenivorans TaxID=2030798 RepID=A0ABV7ALY7_9RHOB
MSLDWASYASVAGSSLSASVMALAGLSIWQNRRRQRPGGAFGEDAAGTVFLFDGEDLVDASDAGRMLLGCDRLEGRTAWHRLLSFVAPRFPDFAPRLARLPELGRFVLSAEGPPPLTLRAEWRGGLIRITLREAGEPGGGALDPISQRALEDELGGLRATLDEAPFLAWRAGPDGSVTWANRPYLLMAARCDPADAEIGWPLPRLFAPHDGNTRRGALAPQDRDAPLWFDCHSLPLNGETLHFALPADATVEAETSLRSFIQTLSKTFAQLTVGLAIFDRRRALVLFNPALVELTALSPEFLSSRPQLPCFLDKMREGRMIPEPKDYKSWRTRVAALEKAAGSGQYEEIWSLPSGQTYRVTGRPHPDGATALLFEDISAETTLNRRFRAEIELSQAVIDTMEEAIAVFSPAGLLILSNDAYRALWQTEADSALGETGIVEATGLWQSRCTPNPLWNEARDFVGTVGPRQRRSGEARLRDGRPLRCRFVPLTGGATLIGFSIRHATPGQPRPEVARTTRRLA